MAQVDLIFVAPPVTGQPVELVFGQTEEDLSNKVSVAFALPGPAVSVDLDRVLPPATEVTISMTLGLPVVSVAAGYDLNVSRPMVGRTEMRHQVAVPAETGWQDAARRADKIDAGPTDRAQQAVKLSTQHEAPHDKMAPRRAALIGRTQQGVKLSASSTFRHQVMIRDRRQALEVRSQEGLRRFNSVRPSHQERIRMRGELAGRSQHGMPVRVGLRQRDGSGMAAMQDWGVRSQQAMKPNAGRAPIVVPPLPEPCYTPNPHLLFASPPGDSHLLFFCENHDTPPPDGETVIVPVRSVYIVLNEVLLRRVDGDIPIPARSVSLSIDTDSWTWTFSASVPRIAQQYLEPVNGDPAELELSINGNLYRLLAENISRDRSFGQTNVSVGGRGKSALLSAPYSPILTFSNSSDRTAQQLMADVLSFNGVPLDWSVDWQLDDWLVPAGVFNQQGTYIEALNSIVGAAGAYLQPDPVEQSLRALLRYPVMPWKWATDVTPDFEIPAAVISREGVEWRTKPAYNRVFVSGQQQGVLGQVTRAGTAGDLAAPMITDPLITDAIAARQRGSAVLGDTGRQAMFSLGLPVLEETGVIPPGKFIRYVDNGVQRIGLTRGVSLSYGAGNTSLRQSLLVETHE